MYLEALVLPCRRVFTSSDSRRNQWLVGFQLNLATPGQFKRLATSRRKLNLHQNQPGNFSETLSIENKHMYANVLDPGVSLAPVQSRMTRFVSIF